MVVVQLKYLSYVTFSPPIMHVSKTLTDLYFREMASYGYIMVELSDDSAVQVVNEYWIWIRTFS